MAKTTVLEESLEYEEYIELDNYDLAIDAILFGLRMNRGISLNEISDKFRIPPNSFESILKFLELLEKECLVGFEDNNIFLPQMEE